MLATDTPKKPSGFIKQLLVSLGLGVALLVVALFASGILLTGVAVQISHDAVKDPIRQ